VKAYAKLSCVGLAFGLSILAGCGGGDGFPYVNVQRPDFESPIHLHVGQRMVWMTAAEDLPDYHFTAEPPDILSFRALREQSGLIRLETVTFAWTALRPGEAKVYLYVDPPVSGLEQSAGAPMLWAIVIVDEEPTGGG
jgi:hypothetical protein